MIHDIQTSQDTDWRKNYERFEILGDAILGFLITEMVFNIYNKSDEGGIAKIKSYLVSKETICCVAEKINLANFIIMTKGEEESGGRVNPNNIENTMEASYLLLIELGAKMGFVPLKKLADI